MANAESFDVLTDGAAADGGSSTLERLRNLILSGAIPPGAVVSQLDLAQRLGVSTTPLREALRQLQAEGLLEAEPNRRPRVPPLEIDDLHAVYAIRILLESLSISLTVNSLSDDDAKLIVSDLSDMRSAASGDLLEWEKLHTRFHRRLVSGAGAMLPTVLSFMDRAERYRRLSVFGEQPRGLTIGDAEHQRIVTACVTREAGEAGRELARHLARTAIGLSATFAPEVDPVPVRTAVALVLGGSPSELADAVTRRSG
jgi:DNA-binding GntR family transcriptional regulator